MKKIVFMIVAILAIALPSEAKSKKGAEIKFKVETHDFGYIKENKGPVSYEFEFKNTGDEPLLVISARASCGCTRPEYPKHPIKPGHSDKIKVTYVPAGRPGAFEKMVTVKTNAKTTHVKIKGSVIPAVGK